MGIQITLRCSLDGCDCTHDDPTEALSWVTVYKSAERLMGGTTLHWMFTIRSVVGTEMGVLADPCYSLYCCLSHAITALTPWLTTHQIQHPYSIVKVCTDHG